jgi:hypothetical protein
MQIDQDKLISFLDRWWVNWVRHECCARALTATHRWHYAAGCKDCSAQPVNSRKRLRGASRCRSECQYSSKQPAFWHSVRLSHVSCRSLSESITNSFRLFHGFSIEGTLWPDTCLYAHREPAEAVPLNWYRYLQLSRGHNIRRTGVGQKPISRHNRI